MIRPNRESHRDKDRSSITTPKKPARLRDVAELAGTSTAVVSYVINDGPRPVAAATRERVLVAIEALDYRPNRAARALRGSQTGNIGLIVPDSTNALMTDLVSAVEQEAFGRGLLTFIGSTALRPSAETAYLKAFLSVGVDGIVVVATDMIRIQPDPRDQGVPVVYLHRRPQKATGYRVGIDDYAGGLAAAGHLLEHGFASIACLAGYDATGPDAWRVKAWTDTVAEAGLDSNESPLLRSRDRRQDAADVVRPWLQEIRRPTALFATSDERALGVLYAASQLGIRVPEDLSVIAFGGTSAGSFTRPPLTTVSMPLADMGAHAIRLLLSEDDECLQSDDALDHPDMEFSLTIGGTCTCLREGRAAGGRATRESDHR